MQKTSIQLEWLDIANFKGIKSFRVNFAQITNILGRNEAGKTTLSDAWHWLLNGKDSTDREDFNIKNTVDVSLNRSAHEVSAGLRVNGEAITLKRRLLENWRKPKGQIEAVYSGNNTEYFYNDVPLLANEYQKKIAAIIDSQVLKMLTNPFYFNRQPWKSQRAVLFSMAGNITDVEIAASKPEFAKLLADLSNKSLEEYKKKIASDKKLVKDALEKVPVQIGEANRLMPEMVDYTAFETDIKNKQNAIADIDIVINDETVRVNRINQANTAKSQQINTLKMQVMNIENDIRMTQQRAANEITNKKSQLSNNIQNVEASIKSKKNLIDSSELQIETKKSERAKLHAFFFERKGEVLEYDPDKFACPTCKRGLEPENITAVKKQMDDNFIEAKTKELNGISAQGIALTKQIEDSEKLIETLKGQVIELEIELSGHQSALNELSAPTGPKIDVQALIDGDERIISTNKQIDALNAELSTPAEAKDLTEQRTQKTTLNQEIAELQVKLSGKGQREKISRRIVELKNEETQLSQQLANLEATEFAIDSFNRFKIEETEKRIDSLFDSVKFKMYDYTVEGNPVETCQTMYKGVPYSDLNTAGKIWAGIDIINALSRFYQVEAPIFLDNRESTTDIPETNMQIINLIVSPDHDVLTVE